MKFIVLSTFLLLTSLNSHDIQVAFFKIYQDADKIAFTIVLEEAAIVELFNDDKKDLSPDSIQAYVNKHFAISINEKKSDFVFSNIENKAKHILIEGIISNIKKKVKILKIKNTCLLSIEDHSNIIEIRLNNQERDFLMNKDRTAIYITF